MRSKLKTFDCLEMKRQAQREVYEETRGLSHQQEVEYFGRAGEQFRWELRSLRRRLKRQHRATGRKTSGKK